MRILHVLNEATNRGNGIVNAAVDIAIEQARQGHTVALGSAGGEYEALLAHHHVQHLLLDQRRSLRHLPGTILRFRAAVRAFRPQIVHAHMRTGLLLGWLWRPLLGYGLVSHVHNIHERSSQLMGLAQRVIVVSDAVCDSMTAARIPRARIRVVLNRILGSPRLTPPDRIVPVPLHHPAIVTVCGLTHRKGISELLAAFVQIAEEVPAAHLYLVGEGPDRVDFLAQVAKLHPHFRDRIHFEGFQANPQAYMLAADVFVLASRRESFALVLIEARAAGCAIVASDVDGIPQALDDGRAGLLVPPADPASLAAALRRLLSDELLRLRLKEQARIGLDQFTISRMAEEILAIYRELSSEPSTKVADRKRTL